MTEYQLKDGRTLVLRDPAESDAPEMVDYLKIVGGETDYLLCDENGIPGLTLAGEEAYLCASRVDPDIAMCLGFVDGELVTVFDLRPHPRQRMAHVATLSLAVKKAYWHLGIGSIAMGTMRDYARANGKLRCLTLDARADNRRAIALYERFGFEKAGLHKQGICVRGDYYDQILMDLML